MLKREVLARRSRGSGTQKCYRSVSTHEAVFTVYLHAAPSRRSLAAVVIEGAGTALRWRVAEKASQVGW